jgi:acetate kinase
MNILVLNAGSSSLKFRVFRMDSLRPLSESEDVLAGGQVEKIGQQAGGAQTLSEAADEVLGQLSQEQIQVDAVGHRVVHGSAQFTEPIRVDDTVLESIRALTELAPLHNPGGIAGIEAARKSLPNVPNVAVFDTAFHHNLPAVAALYALPVELSKRLSLRRYGFHGISYRYVSERLSTIRTPCERMIICHLGNGASACAIRNGVSIDTSMGFTPLEGVIMGSRSGDIDPGLILHLLRKEKMTLDQLDNLLNHESGLKGLSGRSGDVRDLEQAADDGDEASRLALECFAYRVRKYIGAYAAALGGVDALVFTGGIGENAARMRTRICEGLQFLNLELDEERNQTASGKDPADIGADSNGRIWIVPTDEERQIARETYALLK